MVLPGKRVELDTGLLPIILSQQGREVEEDLGGREGEGGRGGGKTTSCPSVVAGQSSRIRLSYLDDAPST